MTEVAYEQENILANQLQQTIIFKSIYQTSSLQTEGKPGYMVCQFNFLDHMYTWQLEM